MHNCIETSPLLTSTDPSLNGLSLLLSPPSLFSLEVLFLPVSHAETYDGFSLSHPLMSWPSTMGTLPHPWFPPRLWRSLVPWVPSWSMALVAIGFAGQGMSFGFCLFWPGDGLGSMWLSLGLPPILALSFAHGSLVFLSSWFCFCGPFCHAFFLGLVTPPWGLLFPFGVWQLFGLVPFI